MSKYARKKWETVKENGGARMERVTKGVSVSECLHELMKELDKLYVHVFVAEQRNPGPEG